MVLEFNTRFGDPETEALMVRMETDLLDVLEASVDGTADRLEVRMRPGASVCVIAASGGYPGAYESGKVISGLDRVGEEVVVFHCGTARRGGRDRHGGRPGAGGDGGVRAGPRGCVSEGVRERWSRSRSRGCSSGGISVGGRWARVEVRGTLPPVLSAQSLRSRGLERGYYPLAALPRERPRRQSAVSPCSDPVSAFLICFRPCFYFSYPGRRLRHEMEGARCDDLL